MPCCSSNGLCTILNADFMYSIACAMRCDADYAGTSRHTDRNQEKCASKQGFLRQAMYDLACFVAIATACA